MQATTSRPKIIVTADGAGVVSHVGSRLLADVADRTTLTDEGERGVEAPTTPPTEGFLSHLRPLHDSAVSCEFSVGWAITERERAAITAIPKHVWADAVDADGGHRDGAGLAEITGLPARVLADYPPGTRVIVRREHPHPGAQLDLMEERDGWRYTIRH